MRIKIVKCEARNAVNIGNIDKFRNKAVGDFKIMDAGHDLFRGSLMLSYSFICEIAVIFISTLSRQHLCNWPG